MADPQLKHPPRAVEFAVVDLLHATEDFTRAYEAWREAPDEDARREALDAAERRLDEAQHEVAAREAMARSIQRMLEKKGKGES